MVGGVECYSKNEAAKVRLTAYKTKRLRVMPGAVSKFFIRTLFFIQAHFLNADVVAAYFQVKVNAVVARTGAQVTNAILIAVFTARTLVYLAERFGFI